MVPQSGAIGVFDSGFGGLHVLRGIVRELPQYDYMYLGDSRRAPYGPRPQDEVLEFTRQGVDFLFQKGAKLIILACHTASSKALRTIQAEYAIEADKKVLGVLVPFAEAAVAKSKTKRIGVLATEGTVQSNSFVREIIKLDPSAVVIQQACPRLVPLVESGEQDSEIARKLIKEYLRVPLEQHIDTLILGCTHYGILESMIREVVGPDIQVISDREVIPRKLAEYLDQHPELESRLAKNGKKDFYSSGSIDTFDTLGKHFFGSHLDAQNVELS